MDPQQELFSAVLMALKEKYEDTGVGVYDTDLPPEDTPYPFVYLADCSESDQATKNEIIGETNLTLKVWHDNIRQRGTVSGILAEDNVELSLTFGLEGKGVDGYATVTAEQQEVAAYVFADTQKTGA